MPSCAIIGVCPQEGMSAFVAKCLCSGLALVQDGRQPHTTYRTVMVSVTVRYVQDTSRSRNVLAGQTLADAYLNMSASA